MDMRGIYTSVTKLRRQVFTEIARLAYEGGDLSKIEELPYKIVPGEVATYRESIFLERAIIGERLRLAMGLPVRSITQHAPLAQGIEEAAKPEKYYESRFSDASAYTEQLGNQPITVDMRDCGRYLELEVPMSKLHEFMLIEIK